MENGGPNAVDVENSQASSSEMQPFDIDGDGGYGDEYLDDDSSYVLEGDQNDNDAKEADLDKFYDDHVNKTHYESWRDWLFPPSSPRSVQLFRTENIAVPCCYLVVGLLQGLSGPLINVYPLDLNATEAQQATLSSLRGLPSTFKLAFGFLSDNVPLLGYRRKSYMFLGWLVTSLSMVALVFGSDLSPIVENDDNEKIVPEGAPSIPFLSMCVLMFGTGFWFADVMADSIVAEKAKLEPETSRGQLQSTCYACRFFGLMIATPFSTVVYSSLGPRVVIQIMAALPAIMLPMIWVFAERKDMPIKSTRDQCQEIWSTVCSRAVWQPLGFVYLYNALQVGNSAWKQYLQTVLHFTSNQLNSLLVVAYVLLYLGIMAYKYYFITWSWRSVYVFTTLLNGFLSALQVLLIKEITFGLSPFLFALGDEAFADFVGGIQFLPTTIMMVHLCPSGSEGASYAMFTTVSNSALNLSGAISTMLLGIWDVSKTAFQNNDVSGMIKLTVLTTIVQTSGVLFVGLLPRTKADLATLHSKGNSGSKVGGFIFLSVTFLSILYAMVVALMNIINPGWMGESR